MIIFGYCRSDRLPMELETCFLVVSLEHVVQTVEDIACSLDAAIEATCPAPLYRSGKSLSERAKVARIEATDCVRLMGQRRGFGSMDKWESVIIVFDDEDQRSVREFLMAELALGAGDLSVDISGSSHYRDWKQSWKEWESDLVIAYG